MIYKFYFNFTVLEFFYCKSQCFAQQWWQKKNLPATPLTHETNKICCMDGIIREVTSILTSASHQTHSFNYIIRKYVLTTHSNLEDVMEVSFLPYRKQKNYLKIFNPSQGRQSATLQNTSRPVWSGILVSPISRVGSHDLSFYVTSCHLPPTFPFVTMSFFYRPQISLRIIHLLRATDLVVLKMKQRISTSSSTLVLLLFHPYFVL